MATEKTVLHIIRNSNLWSRLYTHFEETISTAFYKYKNQKNNIKITEKDFLNLLIDELKDEIQQNQKQKDNLESLSRDEIIKYLYKGNSRMQKLASEGATNEGLQGKLRPHIDRLYTYSKERLLERLSHKLESLPKPIEKTSSNKLLIGGKKLNISECYKIANETLDVYQIINKKNISDTEKHVLLAIILGCSQQVARGLFNGKQQSRTAVREDIVNNYLKTINKM